MIPKPYPFIPKRCDATFIKISCVKKRNRNNVNAILIISILPHITLLNTPTYNIPLLKGSRNKRSLLLVR